MVPFGRQEGNSGLDHIACEVLGGPKWKFWLRRPLPWCCSSRSAQVAPLNRSLSARVALFDHPHASMAHHTRRCSCRSGRRGSPSPGAGLGGAGKSRTMVLLTGLGDNAHVYDQFAFQFTDYFHVIGITRRGYPPSSLPGPGPNQVTDYDLATRARDDIAVLDFLGISKAVFVGRSVAGSELSTIAVKYGHRVEKLVPTPRYTSCPRSRRGPQILAEFSCSLGAAARYSETCLGSLHHCAF
jgi:hypothetical protein